MSSAAGGQTAVSGSPYLPPTPPLGGIPTPTPDIPASATLLALFAVGAITHIALFRRNLVSRGQRFVFSLLMMGFCYARIATLSLRIVWAKNPTNASIALAATVLTGAGVLLLFIVNLIMVVRVVRGAHPAVGWSKAVWWGFRGLVASVVACLIMVVVCSVHSMFTLDVEARLRERQVMLFATVFMTVLAFIPTLVVVVVWAVPNRSVQYPREEFGMGRLETKMALIAFTSVLLTLGAGFRSGVNFASKVGQVEWFHSRAAFYCFNFAIELIVVYTYATFRFEKRFFVPPGSKGPGDYSRSRVEDGGSATTEETSTKETV